MRIGRGRALAKRMAARPLAGGGPLLWGAAERVRRTRTRGAVAESRVTPFTIAFTGRSGSNMLRRLLDSHPEIICHGEVTWPEVRHGELSPKLPLPETIVRSMMNALRARSNIDDTLRLYRTRNGGHRFVGIKQILHYLDRKENGAIYQAALLEPRTKVIVLTRRALFHQALSRLRRMRYGYIEALKGGQVRLSQGGFGEGVTPDYTAPQSVDADEMVTMVQELISSHRRTVEYLEAARKPYLAITYEDLLDDQRKAIGRVLEHLGLPATHKDRLHVDSVKLAPARPLNEQISNYDQLQEAARAANLETQLTGESLRDG